MELLGVAPASTFSSQLMGNLPVTSHTTFFLRPSPESGKVTVTAGYTTRSLKVLFSVLPNFTNVETFS